MTDRYTRRIYLALTEGRDLSSEEETHLAGCATCGAAAERARDFERTLHRDLAERAAPLPADPRGLQADRPRQMAPALVAAVATLLVIAVGGGVALVAMPEPSPTPTPPVVAVTAEPSALPSASPPTALPVATPSSEASLAPEPIIVGSYAQVAGAELTELRNVPEGDAFTEVPPGSEVWVVDVDAGWAQVEALDAAAAEYVFGWIPVEWLVLIDPPECAPRPPTWGFAFVHPQRHLECLAGAPVVLEGYAIGGNAVEPVYRGEPAWLAETPRIALSSVIGPAADGFSFTIHLPPDLDRDVPLSDREGHEGTRLRITGHYNDPASTECDRRPVSGSYPALNAELNELWCRQQLVVDSVEVIDPES